MGEMFKLEAQASFHPLLTLEFLNAVHQDYDPFILSVRTTLKFVYWNINEAIIYECLRMFL